MTENEKKTNKHDGAAVVTRDDNNRQRFFFFFFGRPPVPVLTKPRGERAKVAEFFFFRSFYIKNFIIIIRTYDNNNAASLKLDGRTAGAVCADY